MLGLVLALVCGALAAPLQPTSADPAIFGLRVEVDRDEKGAVSSYFDTDQNIIVVPPSQPFRVSIYGIGLAQVNSVYIAVKSCEVADREALTPASDFSVHWDNKIRLSAQLTEREDAFILCAMTDGKTISPHDESLLSTQAPPRKYMLKWALLQVGVVLVLGLLSAMFSGLTLGLMTLTVRELEIIKEAGSEREKQYATSILPIRKRGNLLLSSFLLGNTIVNTCVTIFMEDLIKETWSSVALTTSLLVLLGEIVPQSICVNKALWWGAHMKHLTLFCMFAMSPVSYPISMVLDYFVGAEHEGFDRARLMELMRQLAKKDEHTNDAGLKIAMGAMSLGNKCVSEVMTPIESVFMVSDDDILNVNLLSLISRQGYTRIPVYSGTDTTKIHEYLIMKDLTLLDPDDNFPVRTVCNLNKHPMSTFPSDASLVATLKMFKKGNTGHVAMVTDNESGRIVGMLTLEDIVEEIIQAEIEDEFDATRGKAKPLLCGAPTIPKAQISSQMQMIASSHIASHEPAFHDRFIAPNVLERLINTSSKKLDLGHLKSSTTTPMTVPKHAKLYTKDEPTDRFITILEGRAQITIGKSGINCEMGPFQSFGSEMLQKVVNNVNDFLSPDWREESLKSRHDLLFRADFSLAVLDECTFMEVTLKEYINALRTTKLQRDAKKNEQASNTAAATDTGKKKSDRQPNSNSPHGTPRSSMMLPVGAVKVVPPLVPPSTSAVRVQLSPPATTSSKTNNTKSSTKGGDGT